MSIVQSTSNGFLASLPVAYLSNNAAGNFLTAIVCTFNTTSTPTVSDSQSNTWTLIDTFLNGGSGATWLYVAYQCKAGANTVTSVTGTTQSRLVIAEYNDNIPVGGLDQKIHANGSGSSINTGSVVTSSAKELLLCYGQNLTDNSATYTGTGGFTNRQNFFAVFLEDRNVSYTVGVAGTCTISSAPSWSAGLATFKITAVPPSPAVVQTINPGFGTSGLSLAMAFGSNNTLGNLLLVQVRFAAGNSGPFTCTDSQGNTYVTAYSVLFSGSTQRFCSFYCLGCKAGANTITVAQGASNFIRPVAMEVSGVPSSSVVEGTSVFASGTSTVSTTSVGTYSTSFTYPASTIWGNGVIAFRLLGGSDYVVAFGGQISVNEVSPPIVPAPFTLEISNIGGANDAQIADATLVSPGGFRTLLGAGP
jgi:hypothetical protein